MTKSLQNIPRGWIYLLLAAVVVWQVLKPVRLPVTPSAATLGVAEAIQAVPPGKLVVISTDWDASTQAETGPQTAAIIEACFQHHKPFAIMNLQPPMGVQLANTLAEQAAKRYHATYGRDWCNWGYKYGYDNVLLAMQKSIPRAIGKDFHGAPVDSLPMMQGINNAHDLGLIVLVTGLSSMTESWIGLIQTPFNIPMAAGYTAVMAPAYYAYLDSGQLKGLLVGAKGAAEMEAIVGRPGQATGIMNVQSWAHLLIIALILLGNLGQLAARRRAKGGGR